MSIAGLQAPAMVHGGNILYTARRLGCAVSELIDMSSNLTPLGMVPGLGETLIAHLDEIGFLPESGSEHLRQLFAERHGLSTEMVLAGNGTTEFIYSVPELLQPSRTLVVNPTYGDYQPASQWAGITMDHFMLSPEQGFKLDIDGLGASLEGGELVFVCNPNNPTGTVTPSATLHKLAQSHPQSFFLVDESYLPFVRQQSLLDLPVLDNLLVLTSFSKIYGIPGLRLGFLSGTGATMSRLACRRKPWGVNRMAQVAGEFVLQHGDSYVAEVVRFVEKERPEFCARLAALPGVEVVAGEANFILSRLTGTMRAGELAERMLEKKVMIRNCRSFTGLDDRYFRLSLKSKAANDYSLTALAAILAGA